MSLSAKVLCRDNQGGKNVKAHPQACDRGERGLQPLGQQLASIGSGAVHSRPPSQQLQQDHTICIDV